MRLKFSDLPAHNGIGRVEDGDAARARAEVREHLVLRIAVVLERAVPAQVIGRDVEHDRHVGRKEHRRGELVGRGFCNVDVRALPAHRLKAGIADVADGAGVDARAGKHVRYKRRRGRLAVRAGYGNPTRPCRAFAPGELDFAHDLGARGLRGPVEIGELGDAGRCDAEVVVLFDRTAVEQHLRTGFLGLGSVGERIGRPIPRSHRHAFHAVADTRAQIRRCRLAAFSEPQNKHAPEISRGVLLGGIH